MPRRFQPGEEAIFARLPPPPPPLPGSGFSFAPIASSLGSRVTVLGPHDSDTEELLICEMANGMRFYASDDMLDRTDDRRALIREAWRNHREAGLRALRNHEQFVEMITLGSSMVYGDFNADAPPMLGPSVERVEFSLETRMMTPTRRAVECRVMCEGEEVERLDARDIFPAEYLRNRPLEFLRYVQTCLQPVAAPPASPIMAAALESVIDQEIRNVMYLGDQARPGVGRTPGTPDDGFRELQARMLDTIAAAVGIPARYLFGRDRRSPDDIRDAAAKSIALLKDWLTPEQLDQYEREGCFEVTGGDTGRRYLIGPPGPYNIVEADGAVEFCVEPFHPDARVQVAPGDFLLTQKIALEKDEIATLRVANRRLAADRLFAILSGTRRTTA